MRVLKLFLVTVMLTQVFGQEYINELSPDEETAGYDLLFNGANLNDWHGYQNLPVADEWNVYQDEPLGPRIGVGPGGWDPLLTNNTYKNMDLKIEYSLAPASNSGIYVRYEEEALSAWNSRSGPQFQICSTGDEDCANPIHMPGSCYDLFPVMEEVRDWFNTNEDWNSVRIIMYDSNYVHYGNGVKLLEYKIGTLEFLAAYNRSKYTADGNNGNYYDIHPGSIMLENHGEQVLVYFRNIKAKELDVHPFMREFPDGEWPDTLAQDFNFGEPTKVGCLDSNYVEYDPTVNYSDPDSCITPLEIPPSNLAFSKGTSVTYSPGQIIETSLLTYSGFPATNITINPDLPENLQFNTATGAISGTPLTLSPPTDYTITVTNAYGTAEIILSLAVEEAPPTNLTYSQGTQLTYDLNETIADNLLSFDGSPATDFSVTPDLPEGLSFNTTNGTVSGTPTGPVAAANYVVTVGNLAGSTMMTLNIEVLNDIVGVKFMNDMPMPVSLDLVASTPNPFYTTTTVHFAVPPSNGRHISGRVAINVYDLSGRKLRTLVDGKVYPGNRTIEFDGRSDKGEKLSPGLYLINMAAGDFIKTLSVFKQE